MTGASSLKRSVVGIGAVCVQAVPGELVAYAIGSCIALCLYDQATGVGAMAHILLPAAAYTGHANTAAIGTKYADHALEAALCRMGELGARVGGIRAAIIGGARMFPHGSISTLNIGEMNAASVVQELERQRIPLMHTDTGGEKSRTVIFRIPGLDFARQLEVKCAR